MKITRDKFLVLTQYITEWMCTKGNERKDLEKIREAI